MFGRREFLIAGTAVLLATAGAVQSHPAPADHAITINGMSYGLMPNDLKVGDTITWTNRDTVPHTVTARDKSFDLRLQPGKTGKITLQKAGTIAIYCIYHPTMRGTLKVS